MSLAKQLYGILLIIFFMIFTGNFLISVKNTKEYLETESFTKAQDTATSLGMQLKPLMKDKRDSEIRSIINAIANRGFYKEIRLEDIGFTFTGDDLLRASGGFEGDTWQVVKVSLKKGKGRILAQQTPSEEENLLDLLEEDSSRESATSATSYIFMPQADFREGAEILVRFTVRRGEETLEKTAALSVTRILFRTAREVRFDHIPSWFINLIPLEMEEAQSEISDGWQRTAIIYVSANPGDAYATLYEEAKGAVSYALIAFALSLGLMILVLRFILQPLNNMEELALQLAKGRFQKIAKLPWTKELRRVAIAMNDMTEKIEGTIGNLKRNIDDINHQLSVDALTGLGLKPAFEADMGALSHSEKGGYIFVAKIESLGDIAKGKSREEVDRFITDFALALKEAEALVPERGIREVREITPYRFFGSEFALIARGLTYEESMRLARSFKESFDKLGKRFGLKGIAHIGGTPFNPVADTEAMLASANEAYESARQVGPNEAFIRDSSSLAYQLEQWQSMVIDIVEEGNFDITSVCKSYLLEEGREGELDMVEAFTSATDPQGNALPIAAFISMVEKFGKGITFDKEVLKKVLDHIKEKGIKHKIAVNLSLNSVKSSTFIQWLVSLREEYGDLTAQVVFTVNAFRAVGEKAAVQHFVDTAHHWGAKVLLKRYSPSFISLEEIHEFGLDYLRLSRELTRDIHRDETKSKLVRAIVEAARLLNVKVYAESVESEEDLKAVKELKLYGASR